MKFSLKEKLLLLLIYLVFTLILSFVLFFYHIKSQNGDGTFAAQILFNLKDHNALLSSYGSSTLEAYKSVWYRYADYVCSLPLSFVGKDDPLMFHFYGIVYLLKPLSKLVNIFNLVAFLQALSFSSVLLFTYLFSRKRGINIISSLLFVFLVSQHPIWRLGIYGQFYFNQLFLPLSALVIWQLDNKKNSLFLLFIFTLLSLSVNEVYGMLIFLIFISYYLLFKRVKYFLYHAIFSLIISISLIYFIQINQGTQTTQTGFFNNLMSPGFVDMIENSLFKKETMIFVLVNLLSIGIFTLNSKKSFILFLLFLTPNLLVDIGGADKIGWSTHYQLSYFVPIVWVSIVGFSILYKKKKYDLLTMGIILALCFNYYVDPYTLKFKKQVVGIQSINNYFKYYVKNGSSELEYRQKLRDAIGIGDVVSSPETAVYNLIDREIYYYPINIDTVDKVIFHYSKLDEKNNLTIDNLYTPNWGHQDNLLDSCIIQRMKRNNFDFDNPIIIEDFAIISKNNY